MLRAAGVLFIALIPAALGPAAPAVDRVEEDWELVVRSADVAAAGPQITTTMCPGPVEDHPEVVFNLNYRDRPTFRPGGLEIQVYDGTSSVARAESGDAPLSTDDETIAWTQRLSLSGGSATYRVQDGSSRTWGAFGGADMEVTFASALDDLSAYSAATSARRSGVGWQSDHVTSMRLLRVRYYSGDMLVSTDDTPRAALPAAAP